MRITQSSFPLPLPREIWNLILSSGLIQQDFCALSLTCGHLREIAQPLAFTEVVFRVGVLHRYTNSPESWQIHPGWSQPQPQQTERLLGLLEFIASPRIATRVKFCKVKYHAASEEVTSLPTSVQEEVLRMPDCWLQDRVIAILPKLTGLRHLVFSDSPIMSDHLRLLSKPSFCCIRMVFSNCCFVEPRITLHLTTSEAAQNQELSTTGLSPAFHYTPLLTISFTQENIGLHFPDPDDGMEPLLEVCRPFEAVQSLSSLYEETYIEFIPRLYHFQDIQCLNMATNDLVMNSPTCEQAVTFPRLEILTCPSHILPNFISCPIHTLTIWKKDSHSRNESIYPADVILQIKPLLARLSSLTLLELEVDAVVQELLSYCHNLKSLVIEQPEWTSSDPFRFMLDVAQLKADTEARLRWLDTTHWPSMLKSVEICPEDPWKGKSDVCHEREKMYRDVLNPLDLARWPPALVRVTFSAFITDLHRYERIYYPFVLVAHSDGTREWRR